VSSDYYSPLPLHDRLTEEDGLDGLLLEGLGDSGVLVLEAPGINYPPTPSGGAPTFPSPLAPSISNPSGGAPTLPSPLTGTSLPNSLLAKRPVWKVDNVAFPINPDSYDFQFDDAQVAYEIQSDGTQIRVSAPFPLTAAKLILTWKLADRRLLNSIYKYFNPQFPPTKWRTLLIDGIIPAMQCDVSFDTPQKTMSTDSFSRKLGEGGTRNDLKLTLRTRHNSFRSVTQIPNNTSGLSAAIIAAYFGGPIGNGVDGIPVWAGNYWNYIISAGTTNRTIENLGTAWWNPQILISGPFTTLAITNPTDVDGTGEGIRFTWTGSPLVAGQTLLFDTETRRCWVTTSGVKVEVYSFTVTTVSDGNPYPIWPPYLPGLTTFSVVATGYSGATSVDFSNAGTGRMNYW